MNCDPDFACHCWAFYFDSHVTNDHLGWTWSFCPSNKYSKRV